jgi:hypothetical protein
MSADRCGKTGILAALLVLGWTSLATAQDAAADGDVGAPYNSPYVYQNTGRGRSMSVTMQYEVGYGSRESRNFGQKGVEQGLRVRFQPWSFLGLEAFGGVLLDAGSGSFRGKAGGVELIGRALAQKRQGVNLDVGAGYLYDYRGDSIPRLRLTLGRSFDRLDVSLSGLMEIPVGSRGRDELDVMTTLAASYGVLDWLRIGMEAGLEDMEGFFETSEAEGGAKAVFGPTLAFTLPKGFFVKMNGVAVYAHLSNQRPPSGAVRPDTWGFMGRAVVGWTWN